MAAASINKVNLESLAIKEELELLKDIRMKNIPQKLNKIGEGATGQIFLYKFEDGTCCAGKKPKISLYNTSKDEKETMKKVRSNIIIAKQQNELHYDARMVS